MVKTHNLGFPRIGHKRELKFVLEAYWRAAITRDELLAEGEKLRRQNWKSQSILDLVPVGDFSFYDQVLDMSFALGNLPERVQGFDGNMLDNYFRVARGRSSTQLDAAGECCGGVAAGEMTKWFDTNYHYIVPEFTENTEFKLDLSRLLRQVEEARAQGINAKPVIIGPVTYLWLGKSKDGSSKLDLLDKILPIYSQLLDQLACHGVEWVQIDEPCLVTELDENWRQAFNLAYHHLKTVKIKLLVATYFGSLEENRYLACNLPVAGLHIDAINAKEEVPLIINILPAQKILSLGVVNGRNIWKTDLNKVLDWLEPISQKLEDRLWIAPSCSLLHVPVDLNSEHKLDSQIKNWLSFALQKLDEVSWLAAALNKGRAEVVDKLAENAAALESRKNSLFVNNPIIKEALTRINPKLAMRTSNYAVRSKIQSAIFNFPKYPTTTIGSFPQTPEIRKVRRDFKSGDTSKCNYVDAMKDEILKSIRVQEALDLDVLVHGEAERNDMVEYFGERLRGYAISQSGWVQSYGSRCVKPPILFGDISRPKAMTVKWSTFAQSQTAKPMKGMLTGPVTLLNWSFVRDDQPRSVTCLQLALAIREEVLDLEEAGIKVIQIDEAALREGLPLRKSRWVEYLDWAVESFRIAANGVGDETQIHTHMCYSEFNDIIEAIARMDADVITIETSRSDMELLDAFDVYNYPNEIGPGVYDIHSPNTPSENHIFTLMQKAATRIPAERLWVNPDCGLKTRQWEEVLPALQNMVSAAKKLRELR